MKRGRNQRRRQGININRALDSNGPDVRIRGTANQIYDKYLALARDASSSGDRVKAENYLQHAEHYFRMIRAMQPAQTPPSDGVDVEGEQPSIDGDRQPRRENGGAGETRPAAADGETEGAGESEDRRSNGAGETRASENGDAAEPRRGRRRRPRRDPQQPREASSEDDGSDETEGAEAAAQ
ncbi:MAG: DUF4167 domain-containing protein [Alphaproteobacteria bacterium]|nr:DUF4167 domain-containing protein [Alphaproteobacteria bacterium]